MNKESGDGALSSDDLKAPAHLSLDEAELLCGYSDLGNTNIDAPILFSNALPGCDVIDTKAAPLLTQP